MAYTISINGVDRTGDVINQSIVIEDIINDKANSCTLRLVDLSGSGAPATDDEIIITMANATVIFGGYIIGVSLQKQHTGVIEYSINCVDYTYILDRFLAHKSYTSSTDAAIIDDLVTQYCVGLGITTTNVVSGVTINSIKFNYIQLSQVMRRITQLTGRNWYIDYNKDIHYFPLTTNPAPFNINETVDNGHVFLQQASDTVTRSTYTFTSQNLGTAASDRYILAMVSARKSSTTGTISSVTIAGVTATILSQVNSIGDGNNISMVAAIAAVPTGTSGTITVVLSESYLRCSVALWSLTNLYSAAGFNISTSTSADPTNTINVPAGGFVVGATYTATTATCTWTGGDEDYDINISAFGSVSGCSKTYSNESLGLTMLADWTSSPSGAGIFISFQIIKTIDYSNLQISKDTSQLKNRVYVRGGTKLSDPTTYSFKGDGAAKQFPLPDKPHDTSMTVNGVAKTIGIKNVDLTGFDYYLNFQEKYLEQDAGITTLATTDTVVFTYTYDIPILVAVEDTTSIAINGVKEFAIFDKSIDTTQGARDRASAELTDYANDVIEGSFTTYTDGFRSGQYININLSAYGINDDYIVQKVTARSMGGGYFAYNVSIASSKTLGIITFLIELLEANKNLIELDDDEVVDELFELTDSLNSDSLTDALTIDSSGPYFTWCTDSLQSTPITRSRWDLFQWG